MEEKKDRRTQDRGQTCERGWGKTGKGPERKVEQGSGHAHL